MAQKTKIQQTAGGYNPDRHKNKHTSIGSSHNTKIARGQKRYRGQGR